MKGDTLNLYNLCVMSFLGLGMWMLLECEHNDFKAVRVERESNKKWDGEEMGFNV